ncbi:MAG: DUF4345 domain-containing protein [Cyanobacteria bacterium P01_G01_bin.54]
MKRTITILFLALAGLLLLAIGGTILFVPHTFYASDGILLGNDPSLLSEIRAPGGLLAGSGLVILMGTFRLEQRSLAVTLTFLVYGMFGLSRLVSLALDGLPSNNLVMAMVIELGVAAIALLIRSGGPHAATSVSIPELTHHSFRP